MNSICALKLYFVMVALAFLAAADSRAAETLNWNYPAANTDITSSSSSTVVNGVTITSSNAFTAGKFTTNSTIIGPAGSSNGSSVGIVQMAMNATVDDLTPFQTLTVRFSEPVYDVSFSVIDIDGGPSTNVLWNDIVEFNSDGGRPSASIVNPTWVSYNSTTGRASAIGNQNAVSGNANQTNGTITVNFNGPITFFTVRHYAATVDDPATGGDETDPAQQVIFIDDVTFKRSARLSIQKTSLGSTGAFSFSISNGFTFTAPSTYNYSATGTTVTTSAPAVATSGTANILGLVNTATTVTETVPGGWVFASSSVTCTDSNTADSGNPASFAASVTNPAFTIAAANIRAGAILTCAVSNGKVPTVAVQKQTTGGSGGPFTFSQSNLQTSPGAISTSAANTFTPVNPSKHLVSSQGSNVILSESTSASWVPGSVTCSDANSTVTGNTNPVATGTAPTVTINSAYLIYGADITCAFTNAAAAPALNIVKAANTAGPVSNNQIIGYTYTITNTGNVPIANVSVADVHNGYGTDPVPWSEVLVTDNGTSGDSTDGGVNGVWSMLGPGDVIRFSSNYTVVQADIDYHQ
jgi:uncharacterized repeat protein (TIGR01451 family)